MKISKKNLYRLLSILLGLVTYFSLLTGISYVRAPERYRAKVLDKFTAADFSPLEGVAENLDPALGKIRFKNEQGGTLAGCYAEIASPDVQYVIIDLTLKGTAGYENGTLCLDLCGENYDNAEQESQIPVPIGAETLSVSLPTGEVPPDIYDLRIFTLDRCDFTIENLEVFLLSNEMNTLLIIPYLLAVVAGLTSVVFYRRFSQCA